MLKTEDVKLYPTEGLAEIYQDVDMKFAFINKKGEQCCSLLKCRDFLHDAVKVMHTGKSVSIYGFRYTPNHPPIDLDQMHMLVCFPDEQDAVFNSGMFCAKNLLNAVEDHLGLTRTEIQFHELDKYYCEFVSPVYWQESSFMVSLYTLLIRACMQMPQIDSYADVIPALEKIAKTQGGNDGKYLTTCVGKLDYIFNHTEQLFGVGYHKGYFDDSSTHTFHDYAGIVSLCNGDVYDQELKSVMEGV
jgi:hypothetical protein